MNLPSGRAERWQVSSVDREPAQARPVGLGGPGTRPISVRRNGCTRRGEAPGHADITHVWGLSDLLWEPRQEEVQRVKGERRRGPVWRLGTPDRELGAPGESPAPETTGSPDGGLQVPGQQGAGGE